MDGIWNLFSRRNSSARKIRKRTSRRLELEALEDRIVPAGDPVHIGNVGYATIQDAINAAQTGAVITVDPGVYSYSTPIQVNKSVTLEGAQAGVAGQSSSRSGNSSAESVIDNGAVGFDVTASNVTIDGFTIEGGNEASQGGFGVFLHNGVSGSHVIDNIVQNNILGLGLANTGASQALIQDNLFQFNNNPGPTSGTGIYSDQNLFGTLKNVLIDHNVFIGNNNAGIDFFVTNPSNSASDITISNNIFNSDAQPIVLYNTLSTTISSNTISDSTTPSGGPGVAIGLYGGDSGIAINNNLLQNGPAYGIRIGNFSTGINSNIRINNNSITGFSTAGLLVDAGGYSGTLNASGNYWGAATGPTLSSNPGGTGEVIEGSTSQVQFAPWLGSGVNTVGAGQPGFSGNQGSLISSNSAAAGSSSAAPATIGGLFQLLLNDLTVAAQLQSSGLPLAQKQFGLWFFLAYSQSPTGAFNLVFDEISLTVGAVAALQGELLGHHDDALLTTLGQIQASIANNPLASTQAGQQLITLTGPLVVAELQYQGA